MIQLTKEQEPFYLEVYRPISIAEINRKGNEAGRITGESIWELFDDSQSHHQEKRAHCQATWKRPRRQGCLCTFGESVQINIR